MKKWLSILLTLVLLSSCNSFKTKESDPNELDTVGDRTTHNFPEVVISIPLAGSPRKYDSLHVVVTATINPTIDSVYNSTFRALNIVEKLETRVSAEILKVTEIEEALKWSEIYKLKKPILNAVKNCFEAEYGKWKYRKNYNVDFAITVFYLSESLEHRSYGGRDFYSK